MSGAREDPNDWAALGWRWCARSGAPHLWNVYLFGGCYGSLLVARPPGDVVLPGDACCWHGSPPDRVDLPPSWVIQALLVTAPISLVADRDDPVEIRSGFFGWVSLTCPERRLRGWQRAARALGIEIGRTRRAGSRGFAGSHGFEPWVSISVRPGSVYRLLAERRARVVSSARVVADLEVAGDDPRVRSRLRSRTLCVVRRA